MRATEKPRKNHEKATKKARTLFFQADEGHEKATEKPRKSHEKVTSKNVTSNEKSSESNIKWHKIFQTLRWCLLRWCLTLSGGGHPQAFPRPRQPLLAVLALRELESACKVSVTVCTVCFSGVFRWLPPLPGRGVSRSLRPKPFASICRPALSGGMDCWRMELPFSRVRKRFFRGRNLQENPRDSAERAISAKYQAPKFENSEPIPPLDSLLICSVYHSNKKFKQTEKFLEASFSA